nr:PREDICTED: uncharacterized protein LOC109031582 [Bemisia tabaci]XP_018898719.1 PREDICTED: uncharacterized protein LOC109031582 [Bemisia tabaci]
MTDVYSYYCCFVPSCANTSSTAPGKIFITVPKKEEQRKAWSEAARLHKPLSEKCNYYCCDDHFNLAEDVANWSQYIFFKQQGLRLRIRLKPNVVPHIFRHQFLPKESPLIAGVNEARQCFDNAPSISRIINHESVRVKNEASAITEDSCSENDTNDASDLNEVSSANIKEEEESVEANPVTESTTGDSAVENDTNIMSDFNKTSCSSTVKKKMVIVRMKPGENKVLDQYSGVNEQPKTKKRKMRGAT